MLIEVLYNNLRYECFDSTNQVATDPFSKQGVNVLTDWNLYLGNLEKDGVILVEHFYDGFANIGSAHDHTTKIDDIEVPISARKIGCALLLVSPDELENLIWLKKDSEKILWREGDDLINAERFFATEQLYYSDTQVQSYNARALRLFDYMNYLFPEQSQEDIAHQMGYTLSAINRIAEFEEEREKEQTKQEAEQTTNK